jgi:hypothetical protein
MAIRFRRRSEAPNEVIGTYSFTNRTVQVLRTQGDRILWTAPLVQAHRQSRRAALAGAAHAPGGCRPGPGRLIPPTAQLCRAGDIRYLAVA